MKNLWDDFYRKYPLSASYGAGELQNRYDAIGDVVSKDGSLLRLL